MPMMQTRRALIVSSALGCCIGSGGALGCSSEPPPTEAVRFDNVRVEEISARRAVVRFETSRETSCEARYGTDPESPTLTATDPGMEPGQLSITHEVPLEDLLPGTRYYWRAHAIDAWKQQYESEQSSFETLAGAEMLARENVALLSAGTSIVDSSSNWAGGADDSSFGILNAFDGKMATEWSSNGDGDEAFVELDLGQVRSLTGVGYRSRQMTDGTSIVTAFRLVIPATDQVLGPFSTPDPAERYEFSLDEPLEAQIVRWEAVETSGGNTGAREIELFE